METSFTRRGPFALLVTALAACGSSSFLLLDGDTVSVSASGTDPDGGSFSLSDSMSL